MKCCNICKNFPTLVYLVKLQGEIFIVKKKKKIRNQFSIKDSNRKCGQLCTVSWFLENLFTFTEEILNKKLIFCAGCVVK